LPCLADYFSLPQAACDTMKRTPYKIKRFHSYKTQQTTLLRFLWRAADFNTYVEVTYNQDYWKWTSHEGKPNHKMLYVGFTGSSSKIIREIITYHYNVIKTHLFLLLSVSHATCFFKTFRSFDR
jgi:hypothetical protein